MFVPFEEIKFCLVNNGCSFLGILQIFVSYNVIGKVAFKSSALLDKADIHTTHRQGPKCSWSKCVIIAGKEVSQEMQFPNENLNSHGW